MAQQLGTPPVSRFRAFAPLRVKTFRTIWLASIFSNFGQLILGVGAAWEMTHLTSSAEMVALVQTALMLPLMLISVPAGAIADMFDRRRIALAGLGFATVSAMVLTTLSFFGLATPWVLLAFCSLIGGGVALYSPAWQASISEQVGPDDLPAAVALGAISYNIARSFGPAVGGVIVLAAGATAAFGVNAIGYIPLLGALFLWRRLPTANRLPPERIDRAIISGARYAFHSSPVRTVAVRAFFISGCSATAVSLTALIAKDQLGGDAGTYGLMLGCYGVGSVLGAFFISEIRDRFSPEAALRGCSLVTAAMVIAIGLSHATILTCGFMALAGASSMISTSMLNVAVQLSVPRWITARALSFYQSALTAGVGIGAAIWGRVAGEVGVAEAFVASGVALALSTLLGFVLPIPRTSGVGFEPAELKADPEVALAITARSGPIIIEINYCVDPDEARHYYDAMQKLQRSRQRNGAFEWSLARDLADPSAWTERFHYPTWQDYLRQRSRLTQHDMTLQAAADAFSAHKPDTRVRRLLERPFGSVRWRAETPEADTGMLNIYTP
ncbi:MAG: MFS transporter [Sphingomonas sp.]